MESVRSQMQMRAWGIFLCLFSLFDLAADIDLCIVRPTFFSGFGAISGSGALIMKHLSNMANNSYPARFLLLLGCTGMGECCSPDTWQGLRIDILEGTGCTVLAQFADLRRR